MEPQATGAVVDVFWFELSNMGLGAVVLALCGWQSIRAKHVTAHFAIACAILSIFWMEAPFDWTFWCQFNPALARFPNWGPLGMTSGGLPIMVPLAYVFFFAIPTFTAVAIARWLIKRSRTNPVVTLLVVGLMVGVVWDVGVNLLNGQAGWARFARGLAGLSIFVGQPAAYSLHETFFITPVMMMCTYFVGRRDERNRSLMEIWADRHATTPGGRSLMTLLASVVLLHIIYALYFIPCFIAKEGNLFAEINTVPLFPGLPPQPGAPPDPSMLWLGVVVLVGTELAYFIAFVATVLLKDPLARRNAVNLSRPSEQPIG